jgi:hypothetical protein
VPDEKPPLDRALDLFVYAPVGMALYVRDMFPSMMGIFVSRGKREVKSHLGGDAAPPTPPIPPVPDVNEFAKRVTESRSRARRRRRRHRPGPRRHRFRAPGLPVVPQPGAAAG